MFKEYFNLLQEIKNPPNKYQIYVDMDGVLTDFESQVKKTIGKPSSELEIHGDDFFWGEVKKQGFEFWSKMPQTKDFSTLWNFLKPFNPSILSAPASRIDFCVDGKKEWIKNNIGTVRSIFVKASNKKDFATSNSILIDDLEKNINDWKDSGGIGILHKSANQTIKELKKYI
jgi:hypothetical protein